MLQMKNMMNMQRMSDMQSMMVPLAHMKQQNIQNKLQYADMVRDINEQKMKILEMYKEVQMMKQEMLAVKGAQTAKKLDRLQGKSGSKGGKSPKGPGNKVDVSTHAAPELDQPMLPHHM